MAMPAPQAVILRHISMQAWHAVAHSWQCQWSWRSHSSPCTIYTLRRSLHRRGAQIRYCAAYGGGEGADAGAVHVQGNAARHLAGVLLLEARSRALQAGGRAGVAGGDTVGIPVKILSHCGSNHRVSSLGVGGRQPATVIARQQAPRRPAAMWRGLQWPPQVRRRQALDSSGPFTWMAGVA